MFGHRGLLSVYLTRRDTVSGGTSESNDSDQVTGETLPDDVLTEGSSLSSYRRYPGGDPRQKFTTVNRRSTRVKTRRKGRNRVNDEVIFLSFRLCRKWKQKLDVTGDRTSRETNRNGRHVKVNALTPFTQGPLPEDRGRR